MWTPDTNARNTYVALMTLCTLFINGVENKPELDYIPYIAIKANVRTRPDMFIQSIQKFPNEGMFPKHGTQRLILLPKGNDNKHMT